MMTVELHRLSPQRRSWLVVGLISCRLSSVGMLPSRTFPRTCSAPESANPTVWLPTAPDACLIIAPGQYVRPRMRHIRVEAMLFYRHPARFRGGFQPRIATLNGLTNGKPCPAPAKGG